MSRYPPACVMLSPRATMRSPFERARSGGDAAPSAARSVAPASVERTRRMAFMDGLQVGTCPCTTPDRAGTYGPGGGSVAPRVVEEPYERGGRGREGPSRARDEDEVPRERRSRQGEDDELSRREGLLDGEAGEEGRSDALESRLARADVPAHLEHHVQLIDSGARELQSAEPRRPRARPRLPEDEGKRADRLGSEVLRESRGELRRSHEENLVPPDPARRQSLLLHLAPDDGELEAAGEHPGDGLVRVGYLEAHPDVGVDPSQIRKERGKQVGAGDGGCAHVEGPSGPPQVVMHGIGDLLAIAKKPAGVLEDQAAHGCGLHSARAAVEELHVERRFERCDPRAHGGLCEEERLRGAREGARVGDRNEGLQITYLGQCSHASD